MLVSTLVSDACACVGYQLAIALTCTPGAPVDALVSFVVATLQRSLLLLTLVTGLLWYSSPEPSCVFIRSAGEVCGRAGGYS